VTKIERAINFDGGPSASLFVDTAKDTVLRAEEWPVRNGMIFSEPIKEGAP